MWKQTGIKYLGITITSDVIQLVAANYLPFLHGLSLKLQEIGKAKLSWYGRLSAFKMVLLPQLLYLYRTLPIPVPVKGKRTIRAFSKRITMRRANGAVHVVIRDYHLASVLTQLKAWSPQLHNTLWTHLESHQVLGNNLYYFLLTSRLLHSSDPKLSPTIRATTQAWSALLHGTLDDSARIAVQLPITSLPCLFLDISITHWNSKGLKTLDDIMVGPAIKTFRTLQWEYNISPNDYLTYLQITHFLHSNQSLNISLPWKSVLFLTNPNTKNKDISLMYMLNNMNILSNPLLSGPGNMN